MYHDIVLMPFIMSVQKALFNFTIFYYIRHDNELQEEKQSKVDEDKEFLQ
jgi:hypothetical protein